MTSSAFSFGAFFLVAALAGVLGALMWWFIRKRRREQWMPILRIMNFPETKLPKIVLRTPPWVSFVCFLICVLAFALWASKPRVNEFATHEPRQIKVHVFVDLSPSVSAQTTLADLALRVGGLFTDLRPAARLTMSTSHSDAIYDAQSSDQWQEIIRGLGFHRAGVMIGPAIRKHLLQAGEIDRLIIVADKDRHSWSGFSWKLLQSDMQVYWQDTSSSDQHVSRTNVFVQNIKALPSGPGGVREWSVDIARSGLLQDLEGTLRVVSHEKVLGTTQWRMSAATGRQINLTMAWPEGDLSEGPHSDDVLTWQIIPAANDAITLDNEFKSTLVGRAGPVRVVAEPSGEYHLDDPGSMMTTALRVMGRNVDRVDAPDTVVDARTGENAKVKRGQTTLYAAHILMGGLGRGVGSFCENPRAPIVWVMPWHSEASYQELCTCVCQILEENQSSCGTIGSRKDWNEWLLSRGGKQIGGDIGVSDQVLAYSLSSAKNEQVVFAMSVPIWPQVNGSISHSSFMLVLRDLLSLGARSIETLGATAAGDWPRFVDLSSVRHDERDASVFSSRLMSSNVPVQESLLDSVVDTDLPPAWNASLRDGKSKGPGKLDSEDPLPWIQPIVVLILLISGLEVLWRFVILRRRRGVATAVILLGCFSFCIEDAAFAKTQVVFLRSEPAKRLKFERLSREIAARTTIALATDVRNFDSLDPEVLSQPWIWVRSFDGLANKQGELDIALVRWLKRGGFLVVESSSGTMGENGNERLEKLTGPLLTGGNRVQGWMPVSQDHEFMRSFYLLEALPTCRGLGWRWFGMDGRVAILHIPYQLSSAVADIESKIDCDGPNFLPDYQRRLFINLLMLSLTTDYKKDQIHLPEILKRLRSP
jgi:hypothetical protein